MEIWIAVSCTTIVVLANVVGWWLHDANHIPFMKTSQINQKIIIRYLQRIDVAMNIQPPFFEDPRVLRDLEEAITLHGGEQFLTENRKAVDDLLAYQREHPGP